MKKSSSKSMHVKGNPQTGHKTVVSKPSCGMSSGKRTPMHSAGKPAGSKSTY